MQKNNLSMPNIWAVRRPSSTLTVGFEFWNTFRAVLVKFRTDARRPTSKRRAACSFSGPYISSFYEARLPYLWKAQTFHWRLWSGAGHLYIATPIRLQRESVEELSKRITHLYFSSRETAAGRIRGESVRNRSNLRAPNASRLTLWSRDRSSRAPSAGAHAMPASVREDCRRRSGKC